MVALAPNNSETSSWDVLNTFPKLHSRAREAKTRICTEAPHSKSLSRVEIWLVIYESCEGLESFTRDSIGYVDGLSQYSNYFDVRSIDPSGEKIGIQGFVVGSIEFNIDLCTGDYRLKAWICAGAGWDFWGWGWTGGVWCKEWSTPVIGRGKPWVDCKHCQNCDEKCPEFAGGGISSGAFGSPFGGPLSCGLLVAGSLPSACHWKLEGICLLDLSFLCPFLMGVPGLNGVCGAITACNNYKGFPSCHASVGIQANLSLDYCYDKNAGWALEEGHFGVGVFFEVAVGNVPHIPNHPKHNLPPRRAGGGGKGCVGCK